MSPTSMPSLPFSSSSSGTFPPGFIPPPPIFTSAFNSSLLSPHFPPLSLPGGNDYHGSKYEPKFEAKFEPNLSARHGSLPSPPTIRTTQQQSIAISASDHLAGKVYNIILSWYIPHFRKGFPMLRQLLHRPPLKAQHQLPCYHLTRCVWACTPLIWEQK